MSLPNPQRILVIMLRRIGDVILTTPAVRALKKLYPNASVDFLVEPPSHEILEGNPDIRKILVYTSPITVKGAQSTSPSSGVERLFDAIRNLRWLSAIRTYFHWIGRIRQERYDWVIDYMGNPRSAVITALSGAPFRAGPAHVAHRWAYSHPLVESQTPCYAALEKILVLKSLGLHPDESDYLPTISVSVKSEQWAQSVLKTFQIPSNGRAKSHSPLARSSATGIGAERHAEDHALEYLVGFAPASRKVTRQWPAASYVELGRLLTGLSRTQENDTRGEFSSEASLRSVRMLIFWGPGEKALASGIARGIGPAASIAPQTESLQDLAALIGRCNLLVTNCNGPKHIAVALRVPTLTIHGSSDPLAWNPPDMERHPVARLDDLVCIGCRSNRCPYDLECMNHLPPQQVFEQTRRLLEGVRQYNGYHSNA